MKLPVPFIQLPLSFDAEALAAEVAALGESVWMPHPQGFAGNSMLPLVAVDGDPANESFAGVMQPTPQLLACPYLLKAVASLGATLGRSRLMRLAGQAEVTRHADQGYYWADRMRVHLPLVTQPSVRFECGDQAINMAAGECWIFDTWRQHRVLNDAEQSRIHLVADTVGGERFWTLVANGRHPDGSLRGAAWAPQRVLPDSEVAPPRYEVSNVPVVMSPWEVAARIGFLLDEARPHPAMPAMQQATGRFCRHWHALWAAYGEAAEGWPEYRRLVDAFMQEMQRLAGPLLLRNELFFNGALSAVIEKMAVTGDSNRRSLSGGEYTQAPAAAESAPAPARVARGPQAADPLFERPVFVVSSPRSGSTMLFEALARAPGVHTIGGESHVLIEGMPALHPGSNGVDSNRLGAEHATAAVRQELRERFRAALKDRNGTAAGGQRLRMLEKTPKNSLRVPFLAAVFPEAEFVYLYRDPCETLGSMIDAWNSGRFRTYPSLPGWSGPAWSLLLVPGWRELVGKPLAEVVAAQWETATRLLLDDLAALPAARVHTVRYDALVAQPQAEVERLCRALGLDWDQALGGGFPLSRYTLSPPNPDKWRRHADALDPLLPRLQATLDRARRFAA